MQFKILPTALEILVDPAEFNIRTLHKCFYWYTRDFNVEIAPATESYTRILLSSKDSNLSTIWEQVAARVHNDLIDYALREMVAEETRTVRELLIAKAFANYDTQESLQSEVSDPVGFHPESLVQP